MKAVSIFLIVTLSITVLANSASIERITSTSTLKAKMMECGHQGMVYWGDARGGSCDHLPQCTPAVNIFTHGSPSFIETGAVVEGEGIKKGLKLKGAISIGPLKVGAKLKLKGKASKLGKKASKSGKKARKAGKKGKKGGKKARKSGKKSKKGGKKIKKSGKKGKKGSKKGKKASRKGKKGKKASRKGKKASRKGKKGKKASKKGKKGSKKERKNQEKEKKVLEKERKDQEKKRKEVIISIENLTMQKQTHMHHVITITQQHQPLKIIKLTFKL